MGFLVLGRKVGQKFFIGNDIIIQVADISGGQVKLAIDAPKDVVIQREELRKLRQTMDAKQVIEIIRESTR